MRRQRRSAMNKASPYRTLTTNSLHLAEQKPDSAPVTSAGLGHESSFARVGGHDRRGKPDFTSLLRSDTRPTRRRTLDQVARMFRSSTVASDFRCVLGSLSDPQHAERVRRF